MDSLMDTHGHYHTPGVARATFLSHREFNAANIARFRRPCEDAVAH